MASSIRPETDVVGDSMRTLVAGQGLGIIKPNADARAKDLQGGHMPHLPRRTATVFAAVFGAIVLAGCTDVTGPRRSVPLERSEQEMLAARKRDKIRNAVDAQERHHA